MAQSKKELSGAPPPEFAPGQPVGAADTTGAARSKKPGPAAKAPTIETEAPDLAGALDDEAHRLNAAAQELLDNPDVESKIVNRRGRAQRVVTLKGMAATKDILILAEYPFATLSDGRGKPTAMQKANRFEYEWDVTDPVTGRTVRALWQVVGDDELGLPTAQDEELYLVLMQISREQGFPMQVRFTQYELLQRLGWGLGKERREDINLGLRRLLGVRIYAENVIRPVPGRPGATNLGSTGFPLVGVFHLENETPGRKKRHAVTDDAGADPADVPSCYFSWSPPLQSLLSEGQMRSLNLEFLLSLKLPISKRLARYLGKKAGDGKTSFEIGLTLLCSRHLNMTAAAYESVMKQRLEGAHDELIGRDFLTRVTYGPMKTRKGEKVLYEFGPKAFETESPLAGALGPQLPLPLPAPAQPAQPALPFEAPLSPANGSSEVVTAPSTQEAANGPLNGSETASSEKAEARKAERVLLERVESVGVSAGVARELLSEFGADALGLQLECLGDREPRDAAATYVKAVREAWAPPGAYTERLEAQAREVARRAAEEREAGRQATRRAAEEREREIQRGESEQLDLLWARLDPATRERLEAEAVDRLGILGRLGKAQSALVAMRRAVLRERLSQLEDELESDENA